MSELSPRLVAAHRVRRLALADATDAERSRALLGELAALLTSYQVRGESVDRTDGTITEVVSQVSASRIKAWWTAHADGLAVAHREVVAGLLVDAGVKAQ